MMLLGAVIAQRPYLVLQEAALDPRAPAFPLALQVLRLTLMINLALRTVCAKVIEVLCYRRDRIHNLGIVIQTVIVCLR